MAETIDYNYYQIEQDIITYITKIKKIKHTDLKSLEDFIREIKIYIFNIDVLKKEYIKKVKIYRNYLKTEEYTQLSLKIGAFLKDNPTGKAFLKGNYFNPLYYPQPENIKYNFYGGSFGLVNFFTDNFMNVGLICENDYEEINELIYNLFQDGSIDYYIISELNPQIKHFSYYKTNGVYNYYESALLGMLYSLRWFIEWKQIEYYTQDKKEIEKIIEKQKEYNFNLTERENEVYNLLKQENFSYKELANKMKISERGVKSHIDNIASKLNVKGKKGIRQKIKEDTQE